MRWYEVNDHLKMKNINFSKNFQLAEFSLNMANSRTITYRCYLLIFVVGLLVPVSSNVTGTESQVSWSTEISEAADDTSLFFQSDPSNVTYESDMTDHERVSTSSRTASTPSISSSLESTEITQKNKNTSFGGNSAVVGLSVTVAFLMVVIFGLLAKSLFNKGGAHLNQRDNSKVEGRISNRPRVSDFIEDNSQDNINWSSTFNFRFHQKAERRSSEHIYETPAFFKRIQNRTDLSTLPTISTSNDVERSPLTLSNSNFFLEVPTRTVRDPTKNFDQTFTPQGTQSVERGYILQDDCPSKPVSLISNDQECHYDTLPLRKFHKPLHIRENSNIFQDKDTGTLCESVGIKSKESELHHQMRSCNELSTATIEAQVDIRSCGPLPFLAHRNKYPQSELDQYVERELTQEAPESSLKEEEIKKTFESCYVNGQVNDDSEFCHREDQVQNVSKASHGEENVEEDFRQCQALDLVHEGNEFYHGNELVEEITKSCQGRKHIEETIDSKCRKDSSFTNEPGCNHLGIVKGNDQQSFLDDIHSSPTCYLTEKESLGCQLKLKHSRTSKHIYLAAAMAEVKSNHLFNQKKMLLNKKSQIFEDPYMDKTDLASKYSGNLEVDSTEEDTVLMNGVSETLSEMHFDE